MAERFTFAKFKKGIVSGDANTFEEDAIYMNNDRITNVPTDVSSYGTLIVVAATSAHIVQFYIIAAAENKMYMRQKTSGSWSSWKTIF